MRFIALLLLSSATGFLALAQEIIWVRIMMYYTGGRPEVFAYVLGSYLAGIAIGSWWTRKLCSQKRWASHGKESQNVHYIMNRVIEISS